MYFGSLNYMLQYVVAFDLTPLVYSKTEAMVKTFEYIIFPIGCPGRIVKKSIAQGGVRFSGQQRWVHGRNKPPLCKGRWHRR